MIAARRLVLRGRRVCYREAGRGRPLVLVHGLGLSSRFWTGHLPALAGAGLRVVAPDLPGFGRSRGPALGMSVEATASWLAAFADAVGLERPAWLGHSLAAQATLALAADSPDRASALALASPTGAPGRCPRASQAAGLVRDLSREPAGLIPVVLREYLHTTPTAYMGTWVKAGRDRPLAHAPRVRCPTLILVGYRDPLVPHEYVAALCRAIPDARVEHIPRGAHGVAFGRAAAFRRRIIDFLGAVA